MEKELVKKVVKITNFTVTEIQKLIDIYKETTQVYSGILRKPSKNRLGPLRGGGTPNFR